MSDSSEYLEAEQPATPLALPGQNLPDKLYVIPIHNRPFFPAQVLLAQVPELVDGAAPEMLDLLHTGPARARASLAALGER